LKNKVSKMCKYGIWCGKDATVAVVEDFSIAFLRIQKDKIANVLKHNQHGVVGAVYGLGVNFDASAVYCAKNPATGVKYCNIKAGAENLENHSRDEIFIKENKDMVYKMYDGKIFDLKLAEQIRMADFNVQNPADNSLSVAERMALWGVNNFFECGDGHLNAGIDTQKYSIYYHLSVNDKRVYCRVGQNGYCERGRAMLSTACIRQNECRMAENNLKTLEEYKPLEECFIPDGCAFPADGGWYWSVKGVTDDVIYLNGCGGEVYEIHR